MISIHASMKLLIAAFVGATVMFWVVSCETASKTTKKTAPAIPNVDNPRKNVIEAAASVGATAVSVEGSANKIDLHAKSIDVATPPEARPIIEPELIGIKTETDNLRKDSVDLLLAQAKLQAAETELSEEKEKIKVWISHVAGQDATIGKLNDEIAGLKDKNESEFRKMMAYLAVICVAGIGICVVIAFFGRSKMAIAVAIGFAVTLAVSVAVTLYLKTIALVTISILGVVFLAAIGYMIWQALKSRKVEEDLIHTGELTKQYLPPDARQHIFGYGAEPGKVDQIQSKATKERVKQIRQYNEKKQTIKMAPSIPEYYRPPTGPFRPVDPYNPYMSGYSGDGRQTII